MKMYGGVEVQLSYSRPRQWMEVSGRLHVPVALLPGRLIERGSKIGH
jgi:hypothetical protein